MFHLNINDNITPKPKGENQPTGQTKNISLCINQNIIPTISISKKMIKEIWKHRKKLKAFERISTVGKD